MILYCDTSALVKLFIDEPDADVVRKAVAASAGVSTHMVAYAEACSAFARFSERRSDKHLFVRLRRALDDHWPEWQIGVVDEALVRRAADFAGVPAFQRVDLAYPPGALWLP